MPYQLSTTKKGLIIKSRDYPPNKKIIFFFTYEGELITLFMNGSMKKWRQLSYIIPLTQVEITYVPSKNGDCFYFQEAVVLSQTDLYQQKFEYIEVIGKISATILHCQMPGKLSPLLYSLCVSYTSYLSKSLDPLTILCSFYLKLLRYEGLVDFSPKWQNVYLFSSEEWQELYRLAYAKEFIYIDNPIPMQLKYKIFTLFDSLFYE